jgi:hypothetical protein
MMFLFRLPFLLVEMLVRRLLRRDGEETSTYAPAPSRPRQTPSTGASYTGAPPPTAEEAIARRVERERERESVLPADEPAAADLRAVADNGQVDREATLVESLGPAEDVGSAFAVDEPWEGYDGMPATAVVQRVRGSDEATRAVVLLYEQQHKARATVLRAAG